MYLPNVVQDDNYDSTKFKYISESINDEFYSKESYRSENINYE